MKRGQAREGSDVRADQAGHRTAGTGCGVAVMRRESGRRSEGGNRLAMLGCEMAHLGKAECMDNTFNLGIDLGVLDGQLFLLTTQRGRQSICT